MSRPLLDFQIASCLTLVAFCLLPISAPGLAPADASVAPQSLGAQRPPPPADAKGLAAFELGELYEGYGDERALAAYTDAAESSDPAVRKKALERLKRHYEEYSWEGHRKTIVRDVATDTATEVGNVGSDLLFGVLAIALLWFLFWLVRLLRWIWRLLSGGGAGTRIQIDSLDGAAGSSGTVLISAFSFVNEEIQYQARIAGALAPGVTVAPQMRAADMVPDVVNAAFDLGERGRALLSFLARAWNPPPVLRVYGSSTTVGNAYVVIVFLSKKGAVVRSWTRSLDGATALDGLKDIAYEALIAVPALP